MKWDNEGFLAAAPHWLQMHLYHGRIIKLLRQIKEFERQFARCGTGGWDTNRNASRYIQNNQNFRSGIGIIIRLSPVQEYKFEARLKRHGGSYDILTNNCGTPAQKCLREIGVNDFFKSGETGNTALGVNSQHVLPVDLGNGLLNSRNFGGVNEYPVVNEPTVWDRLQRAPWAWGFRRN